MEKYRHNKKRNRERKKYLIKCEDGKKEVPNKRGSEKETER
jgi:hypothetical protein